MWGVYNILFVIGYLLMVPHFMWRMARRGGYRRGFMQRFGVYDGETRAKLEKAQRPIWIHAVSVGEMFVALRLMDELRGRIPGAVFVVTTATSTGHGIAAARLPATDVLLYFPVDLPAIVRRVLDAIRPRAILLTESELWPNLIRFAKARGVPVMLVNGRISEKSFRGYGYVRPFVARTLSALDCMLVQGEVDRARLLALGAAAERVCVVGTVKYDMAAAAPFDSALGRPVDSAQGRPERARGWLAAMGVAADAAVIVGGSTWAGEEIALARAWRGLLGEHPGARLVLVPRHAERGAAVARELEGAGFRVVRKAGGEVSGVRVQVSGKIGMETVLVADTTGELMDFYGCATVVFVGKSLCEYGGQNFIEPAGLCKAVVAGPNLGNFPEVAEDFSAARAFRQVQDEAELGAVLRELLGDSVAREAMAQRGRELVTAKRGAVGRMAEAVERVLDGGTSRKGAESMARN